MSIPVSSKFLLKKAVEEDSLCGVALGLVTTKGVRNTWVYGQAQQQPESQELTKHFWWDLASLTKPLFTGRQILRACEVGALNLDDQIDMHLPDIAWLQESPLKKCTVLELLTHTSGLPQWVAAYTWGDSNSIRARLLQESWSLSERGKYVYSDLGYLILGLILERIYGRPLHEFPLDNGLSFMAEPDHSVATELCHWRGRILKGETHDENAAALGGVAGNAGLFGTVDGVLDQVELLLREDWLSKPAQALAFKPQNDYVTTLFTKAKVGWSGGSLCSEQAIGHVGFTGTGFWVDPQYGVAWVLLSNRVHPTRQNSLDMQVLRQSVSNSILGGLNEIHGEVSGLSLEGERGGGL